MWTNCNMWDGVPHIQKSNDNIAFLNFNSKKEK